MNRVQTVLLTFALLLLCCGTSSAHPVQEQDSELLVASVFADPAIVAPVVDWSGRSADGSNYRYGISGWTLSATRWWPATTTRSIIASVDATPIHAQNSNRMYLAGERAQFLEYSAAAYRARGGVRFARGTEHVTDVQAVVLYESVSDIETCTPNGYGDELTRRAVSSMCAEATNLGNRWRRPYAGVEVTHTWSRTGKGNPLISSVEGFEVNGRAELMAGTRSWGRASIVESGGKTFGKWHVSHEAGGFYGSRLDRVNRFLIGGSWDALGGAAVYGFRYGEFRVRRAISAGGGADYRLPGTWRAGVRLSCTDNDIARICGTALNISMTWRTLGFSGGFGVPARRAGAESPRMAYLTAIIPLRQR